MQHNHYPNSAWGKVCSHSYIVTEIYLTHREGTRVVQEVNEQFNTLRPRQKWHHFADNIFKIFLNENIWIPIRISLKFVHRGPIYNIPAVFQIMAWRRPGSKPLSEPMMVSLPTHICVTRPKWVKVGYCSNSSKTAGNTHHSEEFSLGASEANPLIESLQLKKGTWSPGITGAIFCSIVTTNGHLDNLIGKHATTRLNWVGTGPRRVTVRPLNAWWRHHTGTPSA